MIWEIPIIGDFISKPFKAAKLYEFYDRLHLFTVYLLGVFVVLTGAKQHFGNPIDCMLPKQHDDLKSWRDYIHHFCLFYGTFRYQLDNTTNTSEFGSYTEDATINYYQWVPFFFAFQVCCFLLPFWCWAYMQKLIYIDMAFIVDYAGKINGEKTFEKTKEKIDRIVSYMHDHFKFRRAHKIGYFSWITFNSAFPSVLYSITKLLFITNVIFQVNLVCKFLDVDSWTWGFDLVQKFIWTEEVRTSDFFSWSDKKKFASILADGSYNRFQYFPILVGCEYQLHESVNKIVSHKTQCIIPMNVINEKIFIGLYFWLLALTALSVIGIVKWILRLKSDRMNETMIYKLIKKTLDKESFHEKQEYRYNFVHKYLCADGILLIYFMMDSNGFLKTEEVIGALFQKYCEDTTLSPFQTAPSITSDKSSSKLGVRTDYSEVNYGFDPQTKI